MATSTSVDLRGLVFRRASENRVHSWFLGALVVLTVAPFVGAVSYGTAHMLVTRLQPQRQMELADIRRLEAKLHSSTAVDSETRLIWEETLARKQAEIEKEPPANDNLMGELIALFTAVQMGALGLLFWSIAASPTSKLLVEAGAVPAGIAEKETKTLLENLALAAGLPAPKLFVIESSVPNAFAAGSGPQHSVVAVTRGAMALLNSREMEGLLSHELSHIGNHDVQLNAVVAAIALFLRIPYLLFQRELVTGKHEIHKRRNPWRLAISPLGLYIVFVAPLVAAVIRAAVSRGREFQADADAAKLAGSPQGLMLALAKVGGAGSALAGTNPAFAHYYFASPAASRGWLGGSVMATHPPMAERIQMLAAARHTLTVEKLRSAIEAGRRYTREHPLVQTGPAVAAGVQDELASFNRGNPMGRVYRMISPDPAPVHETPNVQSPVLARVKPGSLLVGFDDPGKMRQIITPDQTFGYIDRAVKLTAMDLLVPEEVYDPVARAAAEASLPPLHTVPEPNPKRRSEPLTAHQILLAVGLAFLVFSGVFLALVKFGP